MFLPCNAMKSTNSKTVISVTLGQDEGPTSRHFCHPLPPLLLTGTKFLGCKLASSSMSQGNTNSLSQ